MTKHFVFAGLLLVVVACNALVGNDKPTLRIESASTTDGAVDGSVEQDAVSPPFDAGPSGPQCAAGTKVCDGTCVSKTNSGYGCNNADPSCAPCPKLPHTTPACDGNGCSFQCDPGYYDCDPGQPGCETDFSNPDTCGGCGAGFGCPSNEYCVQGEGGFACSTTCNLAKCGQQCVDLKTNPAHCGGCDSPCTPPDNARATCSGGTCGFECNQGFHACNGACFKDTDAAHCGAQCHDCGSPPNKGTAMACNQGSCTTSCNPGFADCNGDMKTDGCEVDTRSDSAHCGSCQKQCSSGDTTSSSGGAQPEATFLNIGPIQVGAHCCNSTCVGLSIACGL